MVDMRASIPDTRYDFLTLTGAGRVQLEGKGCGPWGRRMSQAGHQPQTACIKGFPQPDWGSGSLAGHCRAMPALQTTVPTGERAASAFPLPQPTAGPGGPITTLRGLKWEEHSCTTCRCKSSIRLGGHGSQATAACPRALVYKSSDALCGWAEPRGHGLAFPPPPPFSCVVRAGDDT